MGTRRDLILTFVINTYSQEASSRAMSTLQTYMEDAHFIQDLQNTGGNLAAVTAVTVLSADIGEEPEPQSDNSSWPWGEEVLVPVAIGSTACAVLCCCCAVCVACAKTPDEDNKPTSWVDMHTIQDPEAKDLQDELDNGTITRQEFHRRARNLQPGVHGQLPRVTIQEDPVDVGHNSTRPVGEAGTQSLFVLTPTDTIHRVKLQVCSSDTIESIKERLQESSAVGLPIRHQRLLWGIRELQDSHTLEHYAIPPEATIHVIQKPRQEVRRYRLQDLQRDGRFTVGKSLGRGATNAVSLVTLDGQEFAGKQITRLMSQEQRDQNGINTAADLQNEMGLDVDGRPNDLANTMRELEIHGSLHHRRIVPLHAIIFDEVYGIEIPAYILQGLGRGGTLKHLLGRLRNRSALDQDMVKGFSSEIVEAVVYLHTLALPVIHRDIKPANIVLNEDHTHLQLCDFGGARRYQDCNMTVIWSPGYDAPEVHTDRYGPSVDIYSIGIVIMEMLGVATAQYFNSRLETLQRHDGLAVDAFGREGASLLRRCWSRTPDERPTAVELQAQFNNSAPGSEMLQLRSSLSNLQV